MKKKIILLRKKLLKRLRQKRYKKHELNFKNYEKIKSSYYNCDTGCLLSFLNKVETKQYEILMDKWIKEDFKTTTLIRRYIGISHKNDILFI